MKKFAQYKKSLSSLGYYVYALCEIEKEKRTPFYIGKGKDGRCLQHLSEQSESDKVTKIQQLLEEDKLGIDILRHGIKEDRIAKLIEATCIDLFGVGELANSVRGTGSAMGRMPIEEIHKITVGALTPIAREDCGLAFILNSTYKSGMSDLELFEATRGVWHNVPRDPSLKYAYATYGGIIKEVYEIRNWMKAGEQQYFTRSFEESHIKNRWEFVGRKAHQNLREKYIGKLIDKDRTYGTPFVKVGC
jgi:hypothetical protein